MQLLFSWSRNTEKRTKEDTFLSSEPNNKGTLFSPTLKIKENHYYVFTGNSNAWVEAKDDNMALYCNFCIIAKKQLYFTLKLLN